METPTTTLVMAGLVTVTALMTLGGCADSLDTSGDSSAPGATGNRATDDFDGKKGDIYGDDDREEYFETESETLRKVSRATAVLVDEENVSTDDGTVRLADKTLREKLPACPTVRFSEQPVPGDCTAFLVAPDVIVTAGHCIRPDFMGENECESTLVGFGFRYEESTDEAVTELPEEDVYSCEEVVAQEYYPPENRDYGVYRLDRSVEGVDPLTFRTDGIVPEDTHLAVVGHMMGLPLKIAAGGRIVDNEPGHWFRYNLDAFGGNSGSPVVDVETGVVEGIHVRGAPDYVRTSHDGESCRKMRRCEEVDTNDSNCDGTEGTRATRFAPHVPTASTGANGTESCCSVCTGDQQACGDECMSASATCHVPYGCACEEPSDDE